MSRLAAVVRAHTGEDVRARTVASALAEAHDTIVIAPDETGGTIDAGLFEKRPHTLAGLAATGLSIPKPHKRALWYLGDYAFYGSFLADDDFDFYFMIEYDVGLRHPGDGYWKTLFSALRAAVIEGVDMIGLHFGPYRKTHFRHPYADPQKVLFAIMGLSRRAVRHLYEARLAEQGLDLPDPMAATHCEVFVPSVLVRDGFTCMDLNAVLPGSYDRAGVNSQLITPIGFEAFSHTHGRLLHRVADVPAYLAKGPTLAARHGWGPEFERQLNVLAAAGVDAGAISSARVQFESTAHAFAERRQSAP